ncbi:MAG: DUF3014 domain-containing protein [Acidobacteriota bacterium]
MQKNTIIVIALVAVIAAVVLVYVGFFRGVPEPEPVASPEPPPAPPQVEEPPPPPALELPPLDASDGFVRLLVTGLSTDPQLEKVIAAHRLIHTLVAVVDNIASGEDPRRLLEFLEPDRKFRVLKHGDTTVINPASYKRYDWAAAVFASLDTDGTAKLLHDLEPLLDEAYQELGYPSAKFMGALNAAIDRLAATPIPDGDPVVRLGVLTYRFADPTFEALSPAEKHLLRMGPANARTIQAKLKELKAALEQSATG